MDGRPGAEMTKLWTGNKIDSKEYGIRKNKLGRALTANAFKRGALFSYELEVELGHLCRMQILVL